MPVKDPKPLRITAITRFLGLSLYVSIFFNKLDIKFLTLYLTFGIWYIINAITRTAKAISTIL